MMRIPALLLPLLFWGCAQLPPIANSRNSIPLYQASFEDLNKKIPQIRQSMSATLEGKDAFTAQPLTPGDKNTKTMAMTYRLQKAEGFTDEGKVVSGYILTGKPVSKDGFYSPVLMEGLNQISFDAFAEVVAPVMVKGVTYR